MQVGRRTIDVRGTRVAAVLALAVLLGCNFSSSNPSNPNDSGAGGSDSSSVSVPDSGGDSARPDASISDSGFDGSEVSDSADATSDAEDSSDSSATEGPDGGTISDAGDAASDAEDGSDAGGLGCPGGSLAYVSVTTTATTAMAPAFSGGSIPDGEYLLTSAVAYNSIGSQCGSNTSSYAETFTFKSGVLRVNVESPSAATVCLVEPYVISGTSIVPVADAALGAMPYSVSDAGALQIPLGDNGCNFNVDAGAETSVGTFVRPVGYRRLGRTQWAAQVQKRLEVRG